MKLSFNFPVSSSVSFGDLCMDVIIGVTNGWTHLPRRIQEITEWIGVSWSADQMAERFEIKIKIKKTFMCGTRSLENEQELMFSVSDFRPDLSGRVREVFRDTIRNSIHKSAQSLLKEGGEMQKMEEELRRLLL
jgi:hypothetical protein